MGKLRRMARAVKTNDNAFYTLLSSNSYCYSLLKLLAQVRRCEQQLHDEINAIREIIIDLESMINLCAPVSFTPCEQEAAKPRSQPDDNNNMAHIH